MSSTAFLMAPAAVSRSRVVRPVAFLPVTVNMSPRYVPPKDMRAPRRCSFRVALGPQPPDLAVAVEPLIDLGFGLEAVDVSDLDAGAVRLDLPVALGDPLQLEDDSRRFSHSRNMGGNHCEG